MLSFMHLFTLKYLLNSYYTCSINIDLQKTTGNLVHTIMEHRLWWNLLNEAPNQYLFFTLKNKKTNLLCPHEESHIVVIPDVLI